MTKLLKLRLASEITGISYYALRKLCIEGKLPYVQIGNSFRVSASDLEEYIANSTNGNG